MRAAVDHVKKTGKLPEAHKSHHDINSNAEFLLPTAMTEFWKERFTEAMQRHSAELGNENEVINWAILDGFLLYYDKVGSRANSLLIRFTNPIKCSGRISERARMFVSCFESPTRCSKLDVMPERPI